MPEFPKNICNVMFYNNPAFNIVYDVNPIKTKKNIKILHNFRHLFYSIKCRWLRDFLWNKIRKPKVDKLLHPDNLKIILDETEEFDYYDVEKLFDKLCNDIKW